MIVRADVVNAGVDEHGDTNRRCHDGKGDANTDLRRGFRDTHLTKMVATVRG